MLRTAALGLIAASALTSVEGFAGAPSALPSHVGARSSAACTAPKMALEGDAQKLTRRAALVAALIGGPAAANAQFSFLPDALKDTARSAKRKKGELVEEPKPAAEAEPAKSAIDSFVKKDTKEEREAKKEAKKQAKKTAKEAPEAEAEAPKKEAPKKEAPKKEAPKKEEPKAKEAPKKAPPKDNAKDLLKKEKQQQAAEKASADQKAKAAAAKIVPKKEKEEVDDDGGKGFGLPKVPQFAPSSEEKAALKEEKKKKKKEKEKGGGNGLSLTKTGTAPPKGEGYKAKGIDTLEEKLAKKQAERDAAKAAAGE